MLIDTQFLKWIIVQDNPSGLELVYFRLNAEYSKVVDSDLLRSMMASHVMMEAAVGIIDWTIEGSEHYKIFREEIDPGTIPRYWAKRRTSDLGTYATGFHEWLEETYQELNGLVAMELRELDDIETRAKALGYVRPSVAESKRTTNASMDRYFESVRQLTETLTEYIKAERESRCYQARGSQLGKIPRRRGE